MNLHSSRHQRHHYHHRSLVKQNRSFHHRSNPFFLRHRKQVIALKIQVLKYLIQPLTDHHVTAKKSKGKLTCSWCKNTGGDRKRGCKGSPLDFPSFPKRWGG